MDDNQINTFNLLMNGTMKLSRKTIYQLFGVETSNFFKLIEKLKNIENNEIPESIDDDELKIIQPLIDYFSTSTESTKDKMFLIKKTDDIKNLLLFNDNIIFKIGNPNTGKSYGFKKENLGLKGDFVYEKISVSGGIGNEFKGLQSSDLAITYNTKEKKSEISIFLKTVMSAILNPQTPHVIFLDDVHNQNISSLLSEYTPVFKKGELVDCNDIKTVLNSDDKLDSEKITTIDEFNETIKKIREKIPNAGNAKILNKFKQEDSIELIFPSNLYILLAGNFNRYTTNIFADWQDRAKIEYISSLDTPIDENDPLKEEKEKYNKINEVLKEQLAKINIYDYEKYTFGIHKVNEETIKDPDSLIKFFFSMIKNSFQEHGVEHKLNEFAINFLNKLLTDQIIKIYKETSKEKYKVFLEEVNNKDLEKVNNVNDNFKLLHDLNLYIADV